jgi:hypothetical protein
MANKLEFTFKNEDGTEVKLVAKKPRMDVETRARLRGNEVFKEAIKSGALLKSELENELKQRGVWNDTKQKELEELNKKMRENLIKIKKGGIKKSEARKLALEVRNARLDLFVLVSDRNRYDDFTVESQVENAKFDYMVSECIFDEEGNRFFKDLEDYEARKDEPLSVEAANQLARLTNNFDPDWQKKLPENKFLIEHKFVNDQLQLVNKDGHRVSSDGKPIDDDYNYVNEQNQKVDVDGNLVDEDGLPIVEAAPFLDDEE